MAAGNCECKLCSNKNGSRLEADWWYSGNVGVCVCLVHAIGRLAWII